jgi:polysaccharide export outer membrane protein
MKKWGIGTAILIFSFSVLPLLAQKASSEKAKPSHAAASSSANKNSQEQESEQTAATTDPAYVIGAEDVLNVSVWKEPEITRTVPVRPDGKISLPLLNDVQAAGLTPMQLSSVITTRLKKYLADPQVTVIVTQINSQRYYIMGEVSRAGAYPLLPNMTILQALSGAGGFTPFAKLTDIYVLRMVDGRQVKLPFNYKDVIKGEHADENVVLKPGDTIIVP